jgi:hypothetical protein
MTTIGGSLTPGAYRRARSLVAVGAVLSDVWALLWQRLPVTVGSAGRGVHALLTPLLKIMQFPYCRFLTNIATVSSAGHTALDGPVLMHLSGAACPAD